MKTFTLFLATIFLLHGQEAQATMYADPDIAKAMEECRSRPSRQWDSQRNMCVTKVEAKELRDNTRACAELEGEAQKACHQRLAEQETGITGGSGNQRDALAMISFMAAGVTGIKLAASKKMGSTTCTSLYIMGGTALAGLAAEYLYKRTAKQKLEQMAKDYKEEATQTDPYRAQKRAFEYLRDEQLAISDLAKKRFHSYLVVAAGFSAAAVYATMEAMGRLGSGCGGSGEGEADAPADADATADAAPSEPTGPDQSVVQAEGDPAVAEASADELTGAPVGMALGHPIGIAAVSAIGAVTSGVLAMRANAQSKQSKSQADRIQTIIDGFSDDFGQFCPQGRDDLRDPRCYCYNADGSENQNRSNSQTCQELWAQRNRNLAVGAGDYNRAVAPGDRKGCFFVNRQFDPECRCRDTKNAAGQNACLKTGMPTNTLGSIGQAMSLPGIINDINKMNDGTFDSGNLDSSQLAQRSAAATRVRDQVFDNFNKNGNSRTTLPSNKDALDALLERARNSTRRVPSSSDPINSMALNRPSHLEGIQDALNTLNLNDATDNQILEAIGYEGASRTQAKPTAKNNNDDFYFDFNSGSAASGGVLDGFMEKEYDFRQNDIVNRDDVSIWDVISYRYVNTGLRRLFGGDLPQEIELNE